MSASRDIPLSKQLSLDRPYDWSNKNIPVDVFLLRVLQGGHLPDIARCVKQYGGQKMLEKVKDIDDPLTLAIASRKLSNAILSIEGSHVKT